MRETSRHDIKKGEGGGEEEIWMLTKDYNAEGARVNLEETKRILKIPTILKFHHLAILLFAV